MPHSPSSQHKHLLSVWWNCLPLALAICTSSCSIVLDWGYNDLECEEHTKMDSPMCTDGIDNDGDGVLDGSDEGCQQGCLEGYTCRIDVCKLHGSLAESDTCNQQRQCSEGLYCDFNYCSRPCHFPYQNDHTCANVGKPAYCAPAQEQRDAAPGLCKLSYCPAQACESNEECIKTFNNAADCFRPCAYQVQSGVYSDNDSSSETTCHPIGEENTLVRLSAGTQQEGQTCQPFTNPCAKGLVCLNIDYAEAVCYPLCSCDGEECSCSNCIDRQTYQYCSES